MVTVIMKMTTVVTMPMTRSLTRCGGGVGTREEGCPSPLKLLCWCMCWWLCICWWWLWAAASAAVRRNGEGGSGPDSGPRWAANKRLFKSWWRKSCPGTASHTCQQPAALSATLLYLLDTNAALCTQSDTPFLNQWVSSTNKLYIVWGKTHLKTLQLSLPIKPYYRTKLRSIFIFW